jgi:hypothetical protein
MSNRYKERRPVAVSIQGVVGGYGFLTNISTADSAALGQIELNAPDTVGSSLVFFGASRPKPPRAKKTSDGTTSFYDQTNGLSAGWTAIKAGLLPPAPSASTKSKLVYVKIDTGFYVWRMPTETYEKVGTARSGLGVKDLGSNDKGFIGVNSIISSSSGRIGKPRRAYKAFTGNDGTDLISTFVEHPITGTIPEGWTIS